MSSRDRRYTAGKYKEKYREPDWSRAQCVRAGNWLLGCVYKALPMYIVRGPDGFPRLTEKGEELAPRLRAELVYRHPVFQPSTKKLADWTGWRSGAYWDDGTRISAPFVRDSHPDTKKAIERAFSDGSMQQHVNGVNALQGVEWKINTAMIPIVAKFAGKIRKKSTKLLPGLGGVGKEINKTLLAEDIATARRLRTSTFYVPMNCDKRGRVYGVPHFNFAREDHVRALFQFAKGVPIEPVEPDGGNINWLMIHAANCGDNCGGAGGDFGGVSKRPWSERKTCVERNKDMIVSIARDPEGTVDLWRDADSPFSFVAACLELDAIWKSDPGYVTHLPVCFDGSCSGIQHLAMTMRDEITGRLVNLVPGDDDGPPEDVYQEITDRVKAWIEADDDEHAQQLREMMIITRKFIKRPAMTFAYSVTTLGMLRQLVEAHREMRSNAELTGKTAGYLAKRVKIACKEVLPRPAAAMDFIRTLAIEAYRKGKILEWRTPTGFPWANRYYESKWSRVRLEIDGVHVRHKVADGYEDELRDRKIRDAAAPNFVHALDASHLINVVNAAAHEGINVAVVHDSFGCLAPQAHRLHLIIREQMAKMYADRDVLKELRDAAGSSLELAVEKGNLDPWLVEQSTYAFA